MTRICSGKLVMLIVCCLLSVALTKAQKWTGITTLEPADAQILIDSKNQNTTRVSVSVPGFYSESVAGRGKNSIIPHLPQGHPMLETGSPDLEKLNFTLQLLPEGLCSVSVLSSEYIDITDVDIPPSAGNIDKQTPATRPVCNENYSLNQFFPASLTQSSDPFVVRNTRSQSFFVYPLQYNPITKVLRFHYNIELEINQSSSGGRNTLQASDSKISPVAGFMIPQQGQTAFKSGQLPPERGCMLIICPEEFRSAIQALADWKIKTGIATEIIDAAQFTNSEALFAFVKEYYQSKQNLAYLLLVGDHKHVPAFITPQGASDNYYSYLSGNDHYPDILTGRFSGETVKDIETQVKRTLNYENPVSSDMSWLKSAIGLASTLSPGDDGESDFQHIRKILKALTTSSYTSYKEFFDGSQGEYDGTGNPSSSDVSAAINEGAGVIFYAGHGSPSGWATGSVTKSVIEGLNNNPKWPVIWSAACETGNFTEKYCQAESWLRATNDNGEPAGALAVLMGSGSQTSYPPMEAQDKIAQLLANPDLKEVSLGSLTVQGLMSMNDVYGSAGYSTTDTWIFFGDPSAMMRTDIPKQMQVTFNPSLGAGKAYYSFKSNVPSGYACLSQDGQILGTATICKGETVIYLDLLPAEGEIVLTLTAHNFFPFQATLDIVQKPTAPVACNPVNHSYLQPVNSILSWDCGEGGNPDYYLLYLGTDNPPTNLVNGLKISANQYKPAFNFAYHTKYFWKVVPVNSFGSAEVPTMEFTTIFIPDEDFEPEFKSRLEWIDGGMQNWALDRVTFFDGVQSMRSGEINNNEFSSLVYECAVANCDFVGFWAKTSTDKGDKLQFLINDSVAGEWSGISSWEYHSFKIEAGEYTLTWRYNKDAEGTEGDDCAWLDNIHLPVHASATAVVSASGSVCQGSEFTPAPEAENYSFAVWNTEGDGHFSDATDLFSFYSSGIADLQNGGTRLKLNVFGFDGCPVIEKYISFTINPLPLISLPSDTIITSGSSVHLDAGAENGATYSWSPFGNESALITIDSVGSENGTKTTTLTVTSALGCSASKDIAIHFVNRGGEPGFAVYPNPCSGNFTIEPDQGSAVIESMKLVDSQGSVVWKNEAAFNLTGKHAVSIDGLSSGEYLLEIGLANGKSVNKLMVK